MKTKIVIVLILIASVAMFGTGAFAMFTATRTATSSVTTGTLGIVIAASPDGTAPADAAFGDTATPWVFDQLVPGESKTGCLWLMNTGNVGTMRALYDFTNLANTKGGLPASVNLADRLALVSVVTTDDWFNWIPGMIGNVQWNPNLDSVVTLQEMANYGGDWESDVVPFVQMAPGGKGAICMTFQMINGTAVEDNPYQGVALTYQAVVTAFNPSH